MTSQTPRRPLTLDEIYDPGRKIDFDGSPPDLVWARDGEHYLCKVTDPAAKETQWTRVRALTGHARPLFHSELLKVALLRIEGITEAEAQRLITRDKYPIHPDLSALLLRHDNNLYHCRVDDGTIRRLAACGHPELDEEFSPDRRSISFVRDNNLFVLDLESGIETALTSDGSPTLLNGRLDWLYQEEIYGRGQFRGHWWSPDSGHIAFLTLDESEVPEYPIVDHIPHQPGLEKMRYPKAGEPNPRAQLRIVHLASGKTIQIDPSHDASEDLLIVRVGWTLDSRHVVFQVQDREQRWLNLNLADVQTGEVRTLLREERATWVGVTGEPRWLKDGSFLWLSERSGWMHLYHYSGDGALIAPVTSGSWEIRELHGVDEASGFVYFSATADSPVENHTYRVRLDGSGMERLTPPGNHRSLFNETCTLFIDFRSDLQTPIQIDLRAADGRHIRSIHTHDVQPLLEPFDLGAVEQVQVENRDGFPMEAIVFKPPDFDAARRYPVLAFIYGGPHAQHVFNAWGGATYMWYRMLAQQGIVVWLCDNTTASGKGIGSAWPVYRRAGEVELQDLEDGIAWLKTQPWVDAGRIGLWGWSYGGYMTLYALTHSTLFKMGIAGAPVTDWRHYDSVYTERYMGTPRNNAEGYDRSSPLKYVDQLSVKLLLIHGTLDDNVHLQNTIQFLFEAQKAGKDVELMVYPKSKHGVTDPLLVKHLRTLMTGFIGRNL